MKIKYRIVKNSVGKYRTEYFEGVWMFGTWRIFGGQYKKLKNAERKIIEYADMVFASHDKVVREITIQ